MVHEPDRQRATGQQLQRGAGQRRQHPPLAQPQPQQAGAFQREHRRGGPRRQRQWHRQGGKTHRQHRIGIAQHPIAGALPQRPGQRGVERAQAQRAQRQRHARGAGQEAGEQAGLQAEGDQRQAEQQATIDQATPALGLAAREQDRHHQVEQEEQQQERLGAGIVLGAIAVGAPQRADAEGEEEAEQVEDAPRTEPGDRHDRRVEQRVVRKQRHVVAAAGGQPQRGQEAGQQREYRQRPGILQYRQQAHTGHQHHAQAERRPGRKHVVELECGEHGQQQHADGATLQAQGEHPVVLAPPPGEHQRRQRHGRHRGQAQFQRQREQAAVGGQFQQGGHAHQRHQHADLHRHVADAEPALQRAQRCAGVRWRTGRRRGRSRRRRPRRRWRRWRMRHPGRSSRHPRPGRGIDRFGRMPRRPGPGPGQRGWLGTARVLAGAGAGRVGFGSARRRRG